MTKYIQYKTPFTEVTGIEYPITMRTFSGHGKAAIAAPVSKAGCFGIITAHNFKTL